MYEGIMRQAIYTKKNGRGERVRQLCILFICMNYFDLSRKVWLFMKLIMNLGLRL